MAALTLAAKLDIQASEALIGTLRDLRGQDLDIDARAVGHLGGHALQTLLVASASWAADGHAFRVTGIGPEMLSALADLGIAPNLLTAEGAP